MTMMTQALGRARKPATQDSADGPPIDAHEAGERVVKILRHTRHCSKEERTVVARRMLDVLAEFARKYGLDVPLPRVVDPERVDSPAEARDATRHPNRARGADRHGSEEGGEEGNGSEGEDGEGEDDEEGEDGEDEDDEEGEEGEDHIRTHVEARGNGAAGGRLTWQKARKRPPTPTLGEVSGEDGEEEGERSEASEAEGTLVRPAKRARTCVPKTLDETLSQVRDQGLLETGVEAPAFDSVVRELLRRLQRSTDNWKAEFPNSDLALLGRLLLVETFGDLARKRICSTVADWYSARGACEAARAASRAGDLATTLTEANQRGLAGLTELWRKVALDDAAVSRAAGASVIALYEKVRLYRKWRRLANLSADQAEGLATFLSEQGFPPRQGARLQSRIASFLCARLAIKRSRTFTDRIYNSAPVAILVEVFGFGVLAFAPRNVEKTYKRLSARGVLSKEEKFRRAVETLAVVAPGLRGLCDAAQESIVEPLLHRQPLAPTTATRLASAGRSAELDHLSLQALVRRETSGDERVEPLED